MSSLLDDGNKLLHKTGQKINELIDLVTLHHLLAVSVSSLPSEEGSAERKRLAALQTKIETFAFDIFKTSKLDKKLSEGNAEDSKNEIFPGFVMQCNSLRECLELYKRDLHKLIFIQNGLSNKPTDFLMWEGVPSGFHCSSMLHHNIKPAKAIGNTKDERRNHSTRMEDVARKIAILVKSLVANVSVQVWTIENYSSIDMQDWMETSGRATCLSGILILLRRNRKLLFGFLASLAILILVGIIGIILLLV